MLAVPGLQRMLTVDDDWTIEGSTPSATCECRMMRRTTYLFCNLRAIRAPRAPASVLSVMALAVTLLLAGTVTERVAADDMHGYATRSGLQFSVPVRMRPAAAPAGLGSDSQRVEHVFSDGSSQPLQLLVVSSPARTQVLPPDSDNVRREFADGFAAGAQQVLSKLELRDVTPRAYEPARGAFAVELSATGPSRARMMLDAAADGPVWAEVRKSGEDPNALRCFLTQLLGGAKAVAAAQLRANSSIAAERCGTQLQRIERFVGSVDATAFAPSAVSLSSVAFFTRFATVTFYATAPAERIADVRALAAVLWSTTSVTDDVRVDVSGTPLDSAQLIGITLGSLLSILTLGGGLAWAITRWRHVAAATAVRITFSTLNALLLLRLALSHEMPAAAWVQLGAYLLSSVALYRPITRWLAARSSAPPPERPATGQQL